MPEITEPAFYADYEIKVPAKRTQFSILNIPGAEKPFNVGVELQSESELTAFFGYLNAHGIDAVWAPRKLVSSYDGTNADPAFKAALKALGDESKGSIEVDSYRYTSIKVIAKSEAELDAPRIQVEDFLRRWGCQFNVGVSAKFPANTKGKVVSSSETRV